ncbi:hypothetical protein Tco_0743233 [Tanacetum coccineum]
MLQLRWIPFQIACAASLFGSALYFRRWLKQKQQPLTLIYNEKLEKAANFDLGSYIDKVEKRLIKVINHNLKIKKFLLYTHYEGEYKSQVTRLIRYAVNSNVQELDLSFWSDDGWLKNVVLKFNWRLFVSGGFSEWGRIVGMERKHCFIKLDISTCDDFVSFEIIVEIAFLIVRVANEECGYGFCAEFVSCVVIGYYSPKNEEESKLGIGLLLPFQVLNEEFMNSVPLSLLICLI